MPQCGNKHTPDSTRKEGIPSRVTKAHCQQLKLHDSMSLHRGEGQGGPRGRGVWAKKGQMSITRFQCRGSWSQLLPNCQAGSPQLGGSPAMPGTEEKRAA